MTAEARFAHIAATHSYIDRDYCHSAECGLGRWNLRRRTVLKFNPRLPSAHLKFSSQGKPIRHQQGRLSPAKSVQNPERAQIGYASIG
jgi:hypothetical protein